MAHAAVDDVQAVIQLIFKAQKLRASLKGSPVAGDFDAADTESLRAIPVLPYIREKYAENLRTGVSLGSQFQHTWTISKEVSPALFGDQERKLVCTYKSFADDAKMRIIKSYEVDLKDQRYVTIRENAMPGWAARWNFGHYMSV